MTVNGKGNAGNSASVSRTHFLRAMAGAGAAVSMPVPAGAQRTSAPRRRLPNALVLSGGGARGAYQAGIIGGLAAAAGVADGQALPPYDFICGTSIGALNGWMVATGQYARLRQLWSSIAAQNILRIKPQFAAIRDKNSGLATRFGQSISLLSGLRTDVRGVFQSEPVEAWLKANVDPRQPVLVPFVWTATNLTAQRTEYFYRAPRALPDANRGALLAAFRMTLGPSAVFREIADDELHLALFASAAIPIVFDPVVLRSASGAPHQYVDGGVASNTPIGLARTVARHVQVVLLDPPFETESYESAVAVGFGVYGTMQRRLLENDIRAAFLQSIGHEQVPDVTALTTDFGLQADDVETLRSYLAQARDIELSYIRPQKQLPLGVGSFADGPHIQEAMELGAEAARSGFTRYTIADFFSANA